MRLKTYEDLTQAELTVSRGGQALVVSVYFIDQLLIDTGPSRKGDYLTQLYREWGISDVILTHHHEDHTGLANWLQQNKQAGIYMHEDGIERCNIREKLPLYRHLFCGMRNPIKTYR